MDTLYHDWAFMLKSDEEYNQMWKSIPFNTDVLITHGPPFGCV